MKIIDLLVLPQPSEAGCKRHLLEEFLRNPFLDDDLQELALRLGTARGELAAALGELCQSHYLKPLGQRGYVLDLSEVGETPAAKVRQQGGPIRRGMAEGLAPAWIETLPFGVALLRSDGSLELANERVATWLGLPRESFDGASFEQATGVDPTQVLAGGSVVSFTRRLPFALEVEVRPCPPRGVLIVVQDISLREELARIQASSQEVFFGRLRLGFVEPLEVLERFLENPAHQELGLARAAVEQMYWMLSGLLVDTPPRGADEDPGLAPEY